MLIVAHAEYRIFETLMMSVIMLNVIVLSVVAPLSNPKSCFVPPESWPKVAGARSRAESHVNNHRYFETKTLLILENILI